MTGFHHACFRGHEEIARLFTSKTSSFSDLMGIKDGVFIFFFYSLLFYFFFYFLLSLIFFFSQERQGLFLPV